MHSVRAFLIAAILVCIASGAGHVLAQTDLAPELRDRPPVAAPTSKIDVGSIPVVLSESQEADNFASGLIRGLMTATHVKGVVLVAVKDDHVMMQQAFGTMTPDTSISLGRLSGVFETIGAMQQIERGKLAPGADIAQALGETGNRGMTLAQVLAFRAGDPSLVRRALEKAAGTPSDDYVTKEILLPLGMRTSHSQNAGIQTTPMDMSHLAIALVHEGAFENGRILQPDSVERMQASVPAPHPALPGDVFGFTGMRRHGWRGLQHDGDAAGVETRLVIVPEAKLAYFIAVTGRPNAAFWHTFDDGLFDKLLPPRKPDQTAFGDAAAPGPAEAGRVAGFYEPARDSVGGVAPLKRAGMLRVRAMAEGTLVLTGDEDATLSPKPGGYWESADANIVAVARDGQLMLSTGAYGPLAIYKRSGFYALLALLAAIGTGVILWREQRGAAPNSAVLGAAGVCIGFLLLSVFVWLFSPIV